MNRKLKNNELGRQTVEQLRDIQKLPLVVVLDDVRSMSNVGSIFRTSDAFGVEKLYLGGITGTPPHREINRTALGATETVPWEHKQDLLSLIGSLKTMGYKICSVEQAEQSISPSEFVERRYDRICLVFGNEVDGVSQEIINLSDVVIEIPQVGAKHSLNVSVAAGLVIWEAYKGLSL